MGYSCIMYVWLFGCYVYWGVVLILVGVVKFVLLGNENIVVMFWNWIYKCDELCMFDIEIKSDLKCICLE